MAVEQFRPAITNFWRAPLANQFHGPVLLLGPHQHEQASFFGLRAAIRESGGGAGLIDTALRD